MIFSILFSYNVEHLIYYDMQRKKLSLIEKQKSLKKNKSELIIAHKNVELTRQFIKSKFSAWFHL